MDINKIKKLEYLKNFLIVRNDNEEYALYNEFILMYLKYLDEKVYNKIINFLDNLNSENCDVNLLDNFMDMYAPEVINREAIILSEEEKRFYANKARFINNLKGTKLSIEMLIRYLGEATIIDANGNILDIDTADVTIEESTDELFTYQVLCNPIYSSIIYNLIKNIHPAGLKIFLPPVYFEKQEISTTVEITDLQQNTLNEFRFIGLNKFTGLYKANGIK